MENSYSQGHATRQFGCGILVQALQLVLHLLATQPQLLPLSPRLMEHESSQAAQTTDSDFGMSREEHV